MTFPLKIFEGDNCYSISSREELQEFAKQYSVIFAAGGVVRNDFGQTLMIYRLGRWDFPKGKIEQGEGVEAAALREVAEETGLADVEIVSSLPTTYHIYMLNGRKILKQTYWFLMRPTNPDLTLIPQREEDIETALWVDHSQLDAKLSLSYPSLKDFAEKIKNDIL